MKHRRYLLALIFAVVLAATPIRAQLVFPSGGAGASTGGTVTSIATSCSATGGTIMTTGTITVVMPDQSVSGTSYTAGANSECGGTTQMTAAGAATVTLPAASGVIAAGWYESYKAVGVGGTTLHHGAGVTLNGGTADVTMAQGNSCLVYLDSSGTNYVTLCGNASGGNANFGTATGNTANDIVTMANTTTGVQDSGVLLSSLAPKVSPTFTGNVAAPAGAMAAPGLTFGNSGTGLFANDSGVGSGQLGFSGLGTAVARIAQGEFDLVSNALITWGNQVNTFSSSVSDTGIKRNAAGVVESDNSTAGTLREFKARSYVVGGSTPTLTGTCTTGSQTGGNTAGTFAATCIAQTVIITFGFTAPNGWACNAHDLTTPTDVLNQTASSTTSCTLTGTTVASDAISFNAVAF